MAVFGIDYQGFIDLEEHMKNYAGDVEKVVNEVLQGETTEVFKDEITRLMPVSDKKSGKHAKYSKSLSARYTNLAVTIHSVRRFGYLYFPDDGSNTIHHFGNQRFFERGIENKSDVAVDNIIGRLVEDF